MIFPKVFKRAPILRRTRRDIAACGTLLALSLISIGGVWFNAPVRDVDKQTAAQPYEEPLIANSQLVPPRHLVERFRLEDDAPRGATAPLTQSGLLLAHRDARLEAIDPEGTTQWSYARPERPCMTNAAWGKFVIVYDVGFGCGDVVSLKAPTGDYARTRSAITTSDAYPISSNDRVGVASSERVELWRSDMVRTLEYGRVEAPQEAKMQPHLDCTITSALTRTTLLVTTEHCPDTEGTVLRFQEASPEDARKPEITQSVVVPEPGARLVAVGDGVAAVHTGDSIVSFGEDGTERARRQVSRSPLIDAAAPNTYFSPAVEDLPHHMTFFDGARLYMFNPGTLAIEWIVPNALGTGIPVGETVAVPVPGGIDFVSYTDGGVVSRVAVDRGVYDGPVYLARIGHTYLEHRGNEVVGLVNPASTETSE